jgi:hypothetical protein
MRTNRTEYLFSVKPRRQSKAAPTPRDRDIAPPTSWRGSLSPPGSPIGRWSSATVGWRGQWHIARSMPRRGGPSAKANDRCAASGTESHRRGSFSAAGPGKNAFHRRWPMTWRGRRQTGVKRKRRCWPSRRAAARHATPISGPAAHGRAFAVRPCRLRAYRRLAGHNRAQNLVALFEGDPP